MFADGPASVPGVPPTLTPRGDLRGSYARSPSRPARVCPWSKSKQGSCNTGFLLLLLPLRALWRRYLFYMACHKWGSSRAHTARTRTHVGCGPAGTLTHSSIRESDHAMLPVAVAFFLPPLQFLFVSRFFPPPPSHCGPNTNAPAPPLPPMSLVGMFSRIIRRISRLLYLCRSRRRPYSAQQRLQYHFSSPLLCLLLLHDPLCFVAAPGVGSLHSRHLSLSPSFLASLSVLF